ncbi:MAG: TIGR03790 family protein [Acidiferrobacterales bacterium]
MRANPLVQLSFLIVLQGLTDIANGTRLPANDPGPSGLGPRNIAVIINDADPVSKMIGAYYQLRRAIPEANIIHVRFNTGTSVMSRAVFKVIKSEVDSQTPPSVQAYVLTWAAPYRVACMSITTAFAAGFDPAYCASDCRATKYDPYFDSDSHAPYTDFGIRPTMSLAGVNFADVKRLIDRGVASDDTFPRGTGYLVSTSDKTRNVRSDTYSTIAGYLGDKVALRIVHADYIADRNDVLFYFTGIARVRALGTDHFRPGAIADHLTSEGGRLTDSNQMSILAWLKAGATGSYGTVVEPCNLADKFPSPGIVIRHYLEGDTLLEAYWKSVAMPGQGIFVGEPLASPYRSSK